LIPQTDRIPERRIPIVPPLDKRLHAGRTDGYRFEDMPHDRDVYSKFGIEAIDEEARARFGQPFLRIEFREQDQVLRAIHDGRPQAGKEIWEQMNVHRFWQLVTTDAIDAYYAHLWAWVRRAACCCSAWLARDSAWWVWTRGRSGTRSAIG
jgi:hypothetical protein